MIKKLTDTSKFKILFTVSTILLSVTSPIAWNYYDVGLHFFKWVEAFKAGKPLYGSVMWEYPPLSPFTFILFALIAEHTIPLGFLKGVGLEPVDYMRVILRIPLSISIIIIGWVLWKREGWRTSKWWLAGLPTFLVFWGYQFDFIPVLFMLLGLYAMIDKRYGLSSFCLAVGTLFKVFPALLFPLIYKVSRDRRMWVRSTFIFTATISAVCLPFLSHFPQMVEFHSARYPQDLSIFHLLPLSVRYKVEFFQQWWLYIWLLPFLAFYLLMLLKIRVGKGQKDSIIRAATLLLLLFLLLYKVGNVNYMLWAYPFLIYGLVNGKVKRPNLLLLMVIMLLYPLFVWLPATTVNGGVFIMQDLTYYRARWLYLKSFEGFGHDLSMAIMLGLETNAHTLMQWLYTNFYTISPCIIILHNINLATIFIIILHYDPLKNEKKKQ